MENLSTTTNSTQIELFNNPFLKDKIYSIKFEIKPTKGMFNPTGFQANINFTNGKTSGQHEINATDFKSLLTQTELFVNSLK